MAFVKGVSIVQLRKLFRTVPEKEELLLTSLSEELQQLYQTAISNTLTPIEKQTTLYEMAAPILFPNDKEPLISLGHKLAHLNFTGVYAFFLRIPKPTFIIKRIANIWHLYHDSGKCFFENFTPTSIDIIISDFPDLPRGIRLIVIGQIQCIMDIVGLVSEKIELDEENPKHWKWHVEWKKL